MVAISGGDWCRAVAEAEDRPISVCLAPARNQNESNLAGNEVAPLSSIKWEIFGTAGRDSEVRTTPFNGYLYIQTRPLKPSAIWL